MYVHAHVLSLFNLSVKMSSLVKATLGFLARKALKSERMARLLAATSIRGALEVHAWLSSPRLCLAWPWLGLAWPWLGLAWLGLAWLGLAWLGLGLAWLGVLSPVGI